MTSYTFSQLIDFTRTSAATYVNSAGNIVSTPASVNLLTFTQEFTNAAWNKSAVTATANVTTAPDGTSTADKIVATAAAGFHYIFQSVTGTVAAYTFSVYAKAAEYSKLQLSNSGVGTWSATFDLATGATIATGGTAVLSSSIQSVGNGWYRCSVTFTGAAALTAHSFVGYPNSGATLNNFGASYTGDGTSGIFVWGAQLELGSSATTYTRNFGGLFPARFDYDPVTLAPRGLLVEEQRTNLLLRSEEFDNASWVKQRSSVTANATTSPDGTVDADRLVEDATASDTHFVLQIATVSSSTTYTYSVYLKASERTRASLQDGGGSAAQAYFDLSNGTVVSASGATATITNAGNGWYRCTITFTTGGAQTTANCRIFLVSTGTTISYTGDGTSGVFIWGAQLEAGSFATSYIPTTASQVTRAADVAVIQSPNFASWYNQTQGTFVAEYSSYASTNASTSKGIFGASDGTINNRLYPNVNTSGIVSFFVAVGNVAQANISTVAVIADGAVAKFAGAYATDNFAAVINGGTVGTDTSGTVPFVDRLSIGGLNGFLQIAGHIRSIRYYPVRLSNAQLQALTA